MSCLYLYKCDGTLEKLCKNTSIVESFEDVQLIQSMYDAFHGKNRPTYIPQGTPSKPLLPSPNFVGPDAQAQIIAAMPKSQEKLAPVPKQEDLMNMEKKQAHSLITTDGRGIAYKTDTNPPYGFKDFYYRFDEFYRPNQLSCDRRVPCCKECTGQGCTECTPFDYCCTNSLTDTQR